MLSFCKRVRRVIMGFYHNHFEKTPPPKDLDPKFIGDTHQGQKIKSYRIGNGRIPCLFIGGIHGNEVGTVKLLHKFMHYLGNGEKYQHLTIHVIPCLNLDGYNLALQNPDYWNDGKVGRVNSRGVDLNRNFPTKDWKAESVYCFGKNYTQRVTINGGSSAGSEKEMQYLCEFIKDKNIRFYWDFHSCGRDCMGAKDATSQKLAQLFCEKTGYRLYRLDEQSQLGFSGHPKEYCEEQGIIFLQNEATYRWGSDWKNQCDGIQAVLKALNETEF